MAEIGLRNAISVGDTRVIHLLFWAGLRDTIGDHTIIYALRHAGGNKIQVVNHILMHASMRPANKTKITPYAVPQEIGDIKDEAQKEKDQEKLDFMDAVTESTWYEVVKPRMDGFSGRLA